MRIPLRQQLLQTSLALVTAVRPLAERIARKDRDLASQLRRALNSVALNVAEGLGREGGNTSVHFEIARGSLYEAMASLRLAAAWGYLSETELAPIVVESDRLAARVFGLARR